MKYYSVKDPRFRPYGRVITDYDVEELAKQMEQTPLPENGVIYKASEEKLELLDIFKELQWREFGSMPIQMGYCNGHNDKLDALEYHKSSEWNYACTELVLLLGKVQDVDPQTQTYPTDKVEAFIVPAGTAFETYSTTLHYAPCARKGAGFRMVVVLPRGTNLPLEKSPEGICTDKLQAAANKWLIAHPDANIGDAHNGLLGENLIVD